MVNFETEIAFRAYTEEFEYFAAEGPETNYIDLCRSLFEENHGKVEAEKIDWEHIKSELDATIEYWRTKC